jgi:hypothetical protein
MILRWSSQQEARFKNINNQQSITVQTFNCRRGSGFLLGQQYGGILQWRNKDLSTRRGSFMSHQDHHAEPQRDPDPADSRADAIAALCAITIAVMGLLFFISQQ